MPPLFRHPVRTVAGAAAAAFAGHVIMGLMPHSLHAFNLTQTSVSVLAIATMMVLVGLHHHREGQILTQTQEEMVLIGGFGLFWLAFLVAMRSFGQRSTHPGQSSAEMATVSTSQSYAPAARREPGFTGAQRPYPCSADDVYCVVEEWTFF